MTNTPYIFENKTYLVLTSNLTSLIAGVIDSILLSGSGIVIVTDSEKTQKEISQNVGILPFLVPVPPSSDNQSFFFDNMPGKLQSMEIELFPIWKGLSIDRLRFWQLNNGLIDEFIFKLSFDVAVVDFDLVSPLSVTWDCFDDTILVKNRTFRTPEHLAYLQRGRAIKQVVTDKEIDIPYLERALGGNKAVVWQAEKPFEPPVEKQHKGECIYYDKRYIWQFNEYIERYGLKQPISFDERSIDMFHKCHNVPNVDVLPPSTVTKPETLVMFAYDEEVIDAINPQRIAIYDPYGVNMADVTSIGDERVVLING